MPHQYYSASHPKRSVILHAKGRASRIASLFSARRFMCALMRRADLRRQHLALADLDDRLLADISVSRAERAQELSQRLTSI